MYLSTVGRSAPEFSQAEIDAAIDRAFAYWDTAHVVGMAYVSSSDRAKRIAYLDSLTVIREAQRADSISLQQLGILRNWQRDKKLASLIGDTLGFSPGYYNLMKIAGSATPEEVEYWSQWYPNAHADIRRLQEVHNRLRQKQGLPRLPFEVVAAIVAVLSPGNSWRINLMAADALLTQRSGKGVPAYPANVKKALFMLRTWSLSPVSGPKVTVFYESLRKPAHRKNELVLDGHMINMWRGDRRWIKGIRQPSPREREQMIADYEQAAQDLQLYPQHLQAVAWYIWRYTEEESPLPPRAVIEETQEMLKADYHSLREAKRHGARRAKDYLEEAEEWGEIGAMYPEEIFPDGDWQFTRAAALAANPETPQETLRLLLDRYLDPDAFMGMNTPYEDAVLRPLAANPSTPPDMLEILALHYPSEVTSNLVWPLLLLENPLALQAIAASLHKHLGWKDPVRWAFYYSPGYLAMNPIIASYARMPDRRDVPDRLEAFADGSALATYGDELLYHPTVEYYSDPIQDGLIKDVSPRKPSRPARKRRQS